MRISRTLAAAVAVLATVGSGVAFTAPAAAAPTAGADQAMWQATSRLNVRTAPGPEQPIVTILLRGAQVRSSGQTQGDFTEIFLEGERYWVASRYLSRMAGTATTTGPPAAQPAAAPAPRTSPTPTPAPTPTPTPVLAPAVAPAPPAAAAVAPAAAQPVWKPKVGASFQVQYTGALDLGLQVGVYNLDHEGARKADIDRLRARGVNSICYFNAGAAEDWRADRRSFPASVVGRPLDGWPGERWLDVRRLDVLVPIMAARMDACKAKGFVAIDPDNTDGWQQDTGFTITREHQIAYQRALADAAHKRGLAIGLKNNVEQLDRMAPFVDFAVNEQCHEYQECGSYSSFLASGKPVFNIEYSSSRSVCAQRPAGMSTIFKDLELSAGRSSC